MQQQPPFQGQDRRELRRPMQGVNADDVARGMARMDPFGNTGSLSVGESPILHIGGIK
jgi:hypothetical protein